MWRSDGGCGGVEECRRGLWRYEGGLWCGGVTGAVEVWRSVGGGCGDMREGCGVEE